MNEAVGRRRPSERRAACAAAGAWDAVLGLDLDTDWRSEARSSPPRCVELVRQRDEARAAKDYAASRASGPTGAAGYEVMDTPEGTKVRRRN